MLFESSVQEVHGLKEGTVVPDAVGVEIEIELTTPFDTTQLSTTSDWSVKSDGSLRNFGLEFVSRPFSLRHEGTVLSKSWSDIIKNPLMSSANYDCPRASVHVHVNVRDYTYNQLMNIILAYLLLEGTLVDYCGRWRRGNLFALRIPEAAANFSNIKNTVTQYTALNINSEQRYSAMNLVSLRNFGTIEFRMLGSVYSPELIQLWASGLRHMVDWAAQSYQNPPDLYRRYTSATREEFVNEFLGDLGREILKRPLKEELFEDGEEYAVELLTASTDEWTYVDDFRNDDKFMKYLKDSRLSRKQVFEQSLSSYNNWKKGETKSTKKSIFGLEPRDWSPEPSVVSPSIDFASLGTFASAPRPAPRRRASAITPPWSEGDVPPTGANIDIYYAPRGQRWIHWSGRLPPEAFTNRERFRNYIEVVDGATWTLSNARAVYDEAGHINEDWVQRQLSRLDDDMSFQLEQEESEGEGN